MSQADSYNVLVGISKGKEVTSLVSTRDETRHGAMRRSIASAFTPAGVLAYEPYVDTTIRELVELLGRKSSCDLPFIVGLYSMEAAARFSFGSPLGCLESEMDVGGFMQMIRNRFYHWGWWSSLPSLERLVFRNPIAIRRAPAPSTMAESALSRLQDRKQRGARDSSQPPDLIGKFIEAGSNYPEQLDTAGTVGMLMSTISGAGDTTATVLTATIYYLLQSPEAMKRLRNELASSNVDKPVPRSDQVAKLPYLQAVIKEGMRLYPTTNWPIERRVPEGGVTLCGFFFPEGVSVGCFPLALHLNTSVFGEDAHAFRPERWIESQPDKLRQMEVAHMGFSRGRRVCLGQHIALMQMKKLIPALVMEFEVRLCGSAARDMMMTCDG